MRALFQGESAYPSPRCRKAIQSMQPLCRRAQGQQTLRSLDDCCQLKCLPQVIAVILLEVYCITVRNIYSNLIFTSRESLYVSEPRLLILNHSQGHMSESRVTESLTEPGLHISE